MLGVSVCVCEGEGGHRWMYEREYQYYGQKLNKFMMWGPVGYFSTFKEYMILLKT